MAIFGGSRPVSGKHFSVDDGNDEGFIRLAQVSDTHFKLESAIVYGGATGLENWNPPLSDASWEQLRKLAPSQLQKTDLASIPAPMRWWINTYGRHTPAALIHDRFIGLPDGLPRTLVDDGLGEEEIDRYFRFMLGDAGIRFVERWIMWSAVALRTRWMSSRRRRANLAVWALLALTGLGALVWAAFVGNPIVFAVGSLAPWPISRLLWGRQWGAGNRCVVHRLSAASPPDGVVPCLPLALLPLLTLFRPPS